MRVGHMDLGSLTRTTAIADGRLWLFVAIAPGELPHRPGGGRQYAGTTMGRHGHVGVKPPRCRPVRKEGTSRDDDDGTPPRPRQRNPVVLSMIPSPFVDCRTDAMKFTVYITVAEHVAPGSQCFR